MTIIRFLLLLAVKGFGRTFYRFSVDWVGESQNADLRDIRKQLRDTKVLTLLNHTSLFEPIYLSLFPNRMLWKMAKKTVVPIADVNFDKPFIGTVLKALAPKAVRLTRRRDKSWTSFMEQVHEESLIAIAPEGRMKRLNGLDKNGEPMTVKGGIADVIRNFEKGRMLMLYSGGLHHIYPPGKRIPRVFKKISVRMEFCGIPDYKDRIGEISPFEFTKEVIRDLEQRRDLYCPLPPRLPGVVAVS